MEDYLSLVFFFISSFLVVGGIIYRKWTEFEVVYKSAKSAFWMVEEIARKQGLISEEKSKLFKEKFRYLMNWAGRFVTKENLELALALAEKFCAKYRERKHIKKEEEGMRPI